MPGVYFSYPFCRQKCTYCNFASGVMPAALASGYLEAVREELSAHEWRWRPDTVYLGGGSPDLIGEDDIRGLLSLIPGRPWREATLEAAPGDVTADKAALWRDCGINRVSLGVQSFVEEEIRRTGRKHTAGIVAEDVSVLRAEGISKINIDLIAGLPGQTEESWSESLDWLERRSPGHVSVYMLEVDDDSRLGREILAGGGRYGADFVPGDDVIVRLYEGAVERLRAMGVHRYEISNFARPGEESLHNLKYWRLEPYAGFGADAHSFDGVVRRENARELREYVDRWKAGRPVCVDESPARLDEERFFTGLRLMEGIGYDAERAGRFKEPVERLAAAGLVRVAEGRLRLTSRGVLLSNEVFQEFVGE